MVNQEKFTVLTFYSKEDGGYISICVEYPGMSAFGKTRVESMKEMETVLDLLSEQLEEDGEEFPEEDEWDSEAYGEFLDKIFEEKVSE